MTQKGTMAELSTNHGLTLKLEQLRLQKFQCLLFVLKQSCICYYIICRTVPLIITARILYDPMITQNFGLRLGPKAFPSI